VLAVLELAVDTIGLRGLLAQVLHFVVQ